LSVSWAKGHREKQNQTAKNMWKEKGGKYLLSLSPHPVVSTKNQSYTSEER